MGCSEERFINWTMEFVRWAVIVVVIYLSVWQYCTYAGYTVFVANSSDSNQGQFWGVFTAIMIGITIVFYIPYRVIAIKTQEKYRFFSDERWYVYYSL